MRKVMWASVASIAVLLVTLANLGAASTAPKQSRILSGWLGTAQATAPVNSRQVDSSLSIDAKRHVILNVRSFLFNPAPRDGFAEFALSGPLLHRKDSDRVGFLAGSCAVTNPNKDFLGECELTANFGPSFPAGNQITIQGLSSNATHWFDAINGGTGRYAGAHGQVEARNIPGTSKIELIFYIDL